MSEIRDAGLLETVDESFTLRVMGGAPREVDWNSAGPRILQPD